MRGGKKKNTRSTQDKICRAKMADANFPGVPIFHTRCQATMLPSEKLQVKLHSSHCSNNRHIVSVGLNSNRGLQQLPMLSIRWKLIVPRITVWQKNTRCGDVEATQPFAIPGFTTTQKLKNFSLQCFYVFLGRALTNVYTRSARH